MTSKINSFELKDLVKQATVIILLGFSAVVQADQAQCVQDVKQIRSPQYKEKIMLAILSHNGPLIDPGLEPITPYTKNRHDVLQSVGTRMNYDTGKPEHEWQKVLTVNGEAVGPSNLAVQSAIKTLEVVSQQFLRNGGAPTGLEAVDINAGRGFLLAFRKWMSAATTITPKTILFATTVAKELGGVDTEEEIKALGALGKYVSPVVESIRVSPLGGVPDLAKLIPEGVLVALFESSAGAKTPPTPSTSSYLSENITPEQYCSSAKNIEYIRGLAPFVANVVASKEISVFAYASPVSLQASTNPVNSDQSGSASVGKGMSEK